MMFFVLTLILGVDVFVNRTSFLFFVFPFGFSRWSLFPALNVALSLPLSFYEGPSFPASEPMQMRYLG